MNHLDFTTIVAVDAQHAEELKLVWPSWLHFRPEIALQPMVIVWDQDTMTLNRHPASRQSAEAVVDFLKHPRLKLVATEDHGLPQRQRMLRELIKAANHVETEWTLKLDTDTLATAHCLDWAHKSEVPLGSVFASNPWGYTKPNNAIQLLDDWADKVPELAHRKRLDLFPQPGSNKVITPGRIISYAFFGKTEWLKWAAKLATDDMPVWSHDTYLWYMAVRSGASYSTWSLERRKQLGWAHCSRWLKEAAAKVDVRPDFDRQPYRKRIVEEIEWRFQLTDQESMEEPEPVPELCGAEVGVSRGETSAVLLNDIPELKALHLVDAWDTQPASEAYRASGDGHAKLKKDEQYDNLLATISNTAFAHDRIRLHRKASELAAPQIADGSLDFVFIDGDHSYAGVKRDLELWAPKVRSGGLVMGHDYGHPRTKRTGKDGLPLFGVNKAFDEYAAGIGQTVHVGEGTVCWVTK